MVLRSFDYDDHFVDSLEVSVYHVFIPCTNTYSNRTIATVT
jgi:hypothetical protein